MTSKSQIDLQPSTRNKFTWAIVSHISAYQLSNTFNSSKAQLNSVTNNGGWKFWA
jgi:hypothetical protein